MELTCDACDVSEDIYRALLTAHWDPQEQRFSSSLFKGYNVSVSRKGLKNLDDTVHIFRFELHNPPKNCLIGVGELSLRLLGNIVEAYNIEHNRDFEVIVVPRPKAINSAHAEVNPKECDVDKITKSLAKKMTKEMAIHSLDAEPEFT